MHFALILSALPPILASLGVLQSGGRATSSGYLARRDDGPPGCTTTKETAILCNTDDDCRRPGSKKTNLPPSPYPDYQLFHEVGEGMCIDRPHLGLKSCGAGIGDGRVDELEAYCNGLLKLFQHFVPEMELLAHCFDTETGGAFCDTLCDPVKYPHSKCGQEEEYPIGCHTFATGAGQNGPSNWGCGTRLPPGAHYAGEKDDPSPFPSPGPPSSSHSPPGKPPGHHPPGQGHHHG